MKRETMMPAVSAAAMAAVRPAAVMGLVQAEGGVETLLNNLDAKLTEVTSTVNQTAESALAEAKKAGEVSAQTKADADKALAEQQVLNKSVQDLKAMIEGLDSKTLEISQAVAGAGPGADRRPMTLGRQVVANEAEIQGFVSGGCNGTLMLNVNNAITTADSSGGGLIWPNEEREPVRMKRRQLRLRELLMPAKCSSDSITYSRQVLRTSGAGMIAEGAASTASEFGWEKAHVTVKKVGTHTEISEEAMADADQLASEIDGELRYLIDLEEERQILAGDGTGENLGGLLTEAPAFVAVSGLPNATRIDRLRLAILRLSLENHIAQEIVLSPVDWTAIEMTKDSNQNYLFGNPHGAVGPILWGKDVVESLSMTAGEWLVGDLQMAAKYYDRQQTVIEASKNVANKFLQDMITIKGRKRVALAIKRPLAMVQGDFTF